MVLENKKYIVAIFIQFKQFKEAAALLENPMDNYFSNQINNPIRRFNNIILFENLDGNLTLFVVLNLLAAEWGAATNSLVG